MPAGNTTDAYGWVARTLHWLTALVILAAIPLGLFANAMPFATGAELAAKAQVFSLHKTLGIAAFAVGLARIAWALVQVRPAPLHPERVWQTQAAAAAHWTLYLSLVLVPLTGWIMHAASDGFAPILWPLPQDLPLVPTSQAVAQAAGALHWVFTKLLAAAILLHVAGGLKHALIDRDGTLGRMVGGRPAGPGGAPRHEAAPALAAVAIFVAVAAAALALSGPPPVAAGRPVTGEIMAAEAGDWHVQDGRLAFVVRQMGAAVSGTFPFAAAIAFDPDSGAGHVTVTIDTAGLSLGGVTAQVRGPDFLATDAHPTATFDAVIRRAEGAYLAEGLLTLRGIARPVALPFALQLDGDVATMQGGLTIDRRDFGIGAGFADEATLGFDVAVDIALTAQRGTP